MTVGLPIPLSFQGSNVVDPVITLEELLSICQSPVFSKGLQIQGDEWIFEYGSDIEYTPQVWSSTVAEAGEYDIDDIVFVKCDETDTDMAVHAGKLVKITGKSGTGLTTHQRPKEPEEYSGWDTGVNPAAYSNRYMRVANTIACGQLARTWYSPSGGLFYYMYWEVNACTDCGDGGWVWSALDVDYAPPRCTEDYLRSCLKESYSTKYDAAKDIKAINVLWGSPYRPKEYTLQFKSMIERDGYFYFRTHLDLPLEYATWVTGTAYSYSYAPVNSPRDIEGFYERRLIYPISPFDGKNYTKAVVDTSTTDGVATWSLLSTDEFNSIAFGKIKCDSLDIKITDMVSGETKFELTNYTIDNSIAIESDLDYNSTVVLYTGGEMMSSEYVIDISVHGDFVEVGEILGAKSVDAGFTKLSFKNKFKDFTPKEQDQWGNWYYEPNGIKVHVHSGTVEFPILRYDQLNRLMILIGGSKVVINSSDSTNNEKPDGKSIFAATMMIARFTSFTLDSSEKNKQIGDLGKYSFELEELV